MERKKMCVFACLCVCEREREVGREREGEFQSVNSQ